MIAFKETHVTSGNVLDLTFPVDASISWKDNGCFDVNLQIPQGAEFLDIHFASTALALGQQGCVDISLDLSNNKFLGF